MWIESDTVECKRNLSQDIRKEIVAFANTRGGTLYIGIDDDGTIRGVADPKKTCEALSSLIRDGIRPDLTVFCEIGTEQVDEMTLVRVTVLRGTKQPYHLADKGMKSSGVYIRLGNTSIPASENAIRDMILEADGTTYENIRSLNQDLAFTAAQTVFERQDIPFGDMQKKTLGLVNTEGFFTNLGLLLSDQCPHSIKIAVFKGSDMDAFTDRKEFGGSLLEQMEQAYAYIDLSNQTRSTFSGLLRTDLRDYAEEALREALLNAIVHRDYAFSGSILVSIYTNRLEIVSLGGLVPGLVKEDIFEGISQSRNANLAALFYRLKYIEAYGTGIRKIRAACASYGVSPQFHITHAAFRVVIPNRNVPFEPETGLGEIQMPYAISNTGYSLRDIPINASHSSRSSLSGTPGTWDKEHTQALSLFSIHRFLTRKLLQEALGVGQTKSGLLLKDLERMGFIEKTGAGRNTAYRLRP